MVWVIAPNNGCPPAQPPWKGLLLSLVTSAAVGSFVCRRREPSGQSNPAPKVTTSASRRLKGSGAGVECPAEAAAAALFVDYCGANGMVTAADFSIREATPGGLAALFERNGQGHAVQVEAN